jgi:hypothetical protein
MLAQVMRGAYSLPDMLVWVIIVVACLAVAFIAVKACGVPVPPWVWQIIGIVVIAFVAICAIRFLSTL